MKMSELTYRSYYKAMWSSEHRGIIRFDNTNIELRDGNYRHNNFVYSIAEQIIWARGRGGCGNSTNWQPATIEDIALWDKAYMAKFGMPE